MEGVSQASHAIEHGVCPASGMNSIFFADALPIIIICTPSIFNEVLEAAYGIGISSGKFDTATPAERRLS